MSKFQFFGSVALLFAVAGSSYVSAQEQQKKKAEPKFVRITRDAKENAETLETVICTYVPTDPAKAGIVVELIGAVHVGEKQYYDSLNREFERYDALLYELVAPEGNNVPQKGQRGDSIVSLIQRAMKQTLELEFQLDHIDYTKKNFIHADMSPKQFSESMEKRGESVFGMFMQMMKQSMSKQYNSTGPSETEILLALMSKDRAIALKRVLAEQFTDLEKAMNLFGGENGSTIITERNNVALKVLKSELGKGKKKIGIFYGAGHFPDMEKKLIADFGLKRDGERWLVAWDMREKQAAAKPVPAQKKEAKPGEKTAKESK